MCREGQCIYIFTRCDVEVVELFPSRYIHLGGDEARKTNWEKCLPLPARMKKEHLANEEDLRGTL